MRFSRSMFASGILLLVGITLAACAPAPTPTPMPTAVPPTPAPTAAPINDAGSVIKLAQIQGFGLFLTDNAGRTLYEFDNDKKDVSNCTGACLENWPPLIVRGVPQAGERINATLISVFTRPDGTMQAEYDGHPLYYYKLDTNPGEVKGHNVGNVWHVLSPRGNPMLNPAPTVSK